MPRVRAVALLLVLPLCLAGADDRRDEETLRAAGISPDGPALLTYFRQRTLEEGEQATLEKHVRNLASRSFATREAAFEALKKRGTPAIPLLREAMRAKDLEVARRAERCLAEIERGPGPEVTLAALRLLASKAPAGAAATLVRFVPHADDENVEEALLEALVSLTPEKGKPDPTLLAALHDPHFGRRAAAGYVLGRLPDRHLQGEVRRLLTDREPAVRLRAAQALLLARDRLAVPSLFTLLTDAPLSLAWQAEEMLIRLAGAQSPAENLGSGEPARRTVAREAWEQWWKKSADRVDLSQIEDVRRLLGQTLVVEYNTNLVWECGPEGLLRWKITDIRGPMEAYVLPGHRILLADEAGVTERDFTGKVLRRFEGTSSPNSCQRLVNGNTFVSTYSMVMEFDPAGKKLYEHNIGGSNAIRKRRQGTIIYTTASHIIEMDMAGKKVRSVPLPRNDMWVGLEELEGDRFLLANSDTGRVIEVDASGKILWEANVTGACGVCRLPGGTTLVAANQRVVELNRLGKTIWEKKTDGYARRVHRR